MLPASQHYVLSATTTIPMWQHLSATRAASSGRYDDAKYWYDKALAADPKHATTLSYYGMWHAEQGNLLKAKDELEKVRMICGTDCSPYKQLKAAIDGTATY